DQCLRPLPGASDHRFGPLREACGPWRHGRRVRLAGRPDRRGHHRRRHHARHGAPGSVQRRRLEDL
ncbi:MAG: hypothetical protein AVDCRST_MAG61-145, partial [uncultured Friedmanniella sp.]